ncbi:N(4)-acetylcytidine aminohydrolase [Escherichia coli]
MQPNDITFFQRFQDDILAGRKTITIRDESESHFKTGDVLRVGRFEDDGYFCTIEVTATSTVTLDDAPRDKCTLSCAINGIHAAFHYLKKNYISGCVMTVPTGW